MTRKPKANVAKRAPARLAKGVTKAQHSTGLVRPGPFVVRPSFYRCLRAYVELLDDGQPVTFTALAKQMGISRVNLWRLRRRHEGLDAWVSDQLNASNAHLVGPVVRRMAMLGLRGSREHAELFLKATGNLDRESRGDSPPVYKINFVNIPEPSKPGEWPGGYHESIGPDDPLRTGVKR